MLSTATNLISCEWLHKYLDHPDLLILDGTIKKAATDGPSIFEGKRIKNAKFFDIKGLFSDKHTDLPNMLPTPKEFAKACQALGINSNHTIIVYDQLGMYSSARVWWMFYVMGHKQIAVLDGGVPAWDAAGFPLEPFPENRSLPSQGNFIANFQQGSVVTADDILQGHKNPEILIIDARSEGRFKGTAPEPRDDLKSGHIPKSVNLPYTKLLKDNKMLPKNELKQIFQNFDIDNKVLIFSCGSGITACILLLAATLAGYPDLKLYDGSWTEWGQLEGVPIEC